MLRIDEDSDSGGWRSWKILTGLFYWQLPVSEHMVNLTDMHPFKW